MSLKRKGICKSVCLQLQNLTITENLLPLELGDLDIVLGMEWLRTLGSVEVDWKALTMMFKAGEETIVLQGDPTLTKSKVTLE